MPLATRYSSASDCSSSEKKVARSAPCAAQKSCAAGPAMGWPAKMKRAPVVGEVKGTAAGPARGFGGGRWAGWLAGGTAGLPARAGQGQRCARSAAGLDQRRHAAGQGRAGQGRAGQGKARGQGAAHWQPCTSTCARRRRARRARPRRRRWPPPPSRRRTARGPPPGPPPPPRPGPRRCLADRVPSGCSPLPRAGARWRAPQGPLRATRSWASRRRSGWRPGRASRTCGAGAAAPPGAQSPAGARGGWGLGGAARGPGAGGGQGRGSWRPARPGSQVPRSPAGPPAPRLAALPGWRSWPGGRPAWRRGAGWRGGGGGGRWRGGGALAYAPACARPAPRAATRRQQQHTGQLRNLCGRRTCDWQASSAAAGVAVAVLSTYVMLLRGEW
jgi:translation initiation factor IF-2